MKKIIVFLLFFFSITTNLFAFKNDYFEVNDEGMKSNSVGNTSLFILNLNANSDYSCLNQKNPTPPLISISVTPNNGERPNYSQENAEKLGKEYVERLRKQDRTFRTEDYMLNKASIDYFRDKKAFYFEITQASKEEKVYIVSSDKNSYTISINSSKGDNFKYIQAYKRFVNSFEITDSRPKQTNKGGLFTPPPSSSKPARNPYSNHHKKTSGEFKLYQTIFTIVIFILVIIAWKIKKSL